MSTNTPLDEIYTAEWFAKDFADLQPEFDVVANGIFRQFIPRKVMDVGCGPGMIVRRLRALGVDAWGVDGSPHARDYAHEDVKEYIITTDIVRLFGKTPLPIGRGPDLLICTEVAEHLDEEHAAGLVELLTGDMCPVVFTAAPPGQDGHHHVNCRPQEYWTRLFESRGAYYDDKLTTELKYRWGQLKRLSHMAHNVMVFT